ncbi:polysaccharide pyruvyl transferase family protein [Clostridium tertium]
MIKRVGIKTVYGEFNLGNKLQNYAVVEVLKRNNLNPTTIRYIQAKFLRGILGNIKDIIKRIIYILPNIGMVSKKVKINLNRLKLFEKFSQEYLEITSTIYNESNLCSSYTEKFDLIIIGSDQVWNDNDMSKLDLEYFLGVSDTVPCASLSASFGVEEISKENKEVFIKAFSKIYNISVREYSGQKIIKELSNRDSILLVDPTMTLSKKEWIKIQKKPSWFIDNDKYILCYFLGGISKNKLKVEEYAKRSNLKVIDILDKESEYYNSGPQEFIYLIRNATIILTDSFHGCVFSIIFNKDFLCFERDNQKKKMNSRVETLLNTFNLNNMMFDKEIVINKYDNKKVNSILELEKIKFDKYLQSILNELNKD